MTAYKLIASKVTMVRRKSVELFLCVPAGVEGAGGGEVSGGEGALEQLSPIAINGQQLGATNIR